MNARYPVLLVSLIAVLVLCFLYWPAAVDEKSKSLHFLTIAEDSMSESAWWIDLDEQYAESATSNIPYVSDDVYAVNLLYGANYYLMYVAKNQLPTFEGKTKYVFVVTPAARAKYESYLALRQSDFTGALTFEIQEGSGRVSKLYERLRRASASRNM